MKNFHLTDTEFLIPKETPSGNPLPSFDMWAEKIYPLIREIMFEADMPDNDFTDTHAAFATSVAAIFSNWTPDLFYSNRPETVSFNLDHMIHVKDAILMVNNKMCPDCGERNEIKGHMTCQYPSD